MPKSLYLAIVWLLLLPSVLVYRAINGDPVCQGMLFAGAGLAVFAATVFAVIRLHGYMDNKK